MKKIEVEIFIPCFIDQFYPETGFNMVKILEQSGCKVSYNTDQTCCGQPAYNAGYFNEAKDVAGKFLKEFTGNKYVVSPSASCTGMIRNSYSQLFRNSAALIDYKKLRSQVFEFTEFLNKVAGINHIEEAVFPGKAVYHDSCSALRECNIYEGPRALLNNVRGLELLPLKDNDSCCGFGGTFSVKFEAISAAMAEQKVNNALEAGAEYIISTDSSCLMQLQGYIDKNKLPIKTMHIADVLASGW